MHGLPTLQPHVSGHLPQTLGNRQQRQHCVQVPVWLVRGGLRQNLRAGRSGGVQDSVRGCLLCPCSHGCTLGARRAELLLLQGPQDWRS